MQREHIAKGTLQILRQGRYQSPSGHPIDLAAELLDCVNNTQYYGPEALASIRDQVLSRSAEFNAMLVEVENETTLQGGARLTASYKDGRIGVLNFASAKNAGGGFLKGAQAQEESLARSSGLYYSLLRGHLFYEYHRTHRSGFYSDRMIYSPHCPVFRSDEGDLLERPYFVDFITSPAPNAGVIQQNEPDMSVRLEGILRERASKILSLAIYHRCDVLVLGAWGCGVFRNDPAMVAQIFRELLGANMPYWNRFRKVAFSVWDASRSRGTYQAFLERFAG
jgi:uncharacterized protein (TIGR02452 family)